MPTAAVSMNTERVKRFLKHISLAKKNIETVEESKDTLNRQIKKIKKHPAISPRKRKVIEKELAKLEEYISDLIQKEISLLSGQSETNRIIKELKSKVSLLESDLVRTKGEDTNVINLLRNKINDLSSKINDVKSIDTQLVSELTGRIENLHVKIGKTVSMDDLRIELKKLEQNINELKSTDLSAGIRQDIEKFEAKINDIKDNIIPINDLKQSMSELKPKIDKIIQMREQRDKQLEDLDKRIKEGFGFNKQGILLLEEQIELLENKLFKIKESGKFSDEDINKLKDKITTLKDKSKTIRIEKLGAGTERSQPTGELPSPAKIDLTTIPVKKPIPIDLPPLPQINVPKPVDDSSGLEFSTHEDNGLPTDSELDIPPPPPEPIKKKWFLSKLLGK